MWQLLRYVCFTVCTYRLLMAQKFSLALWKNIYHFYSVASDHLRKTYRKQASVSQVATQELRLSVMGRKKPVCVALASPWGARARVHTHVSVSVAVPPNVAELKNLEVLNFFNNQIEELPTQISSLQKLKHLNLGWVSGKGEGREWGQGRGAPIPRQTRGWFLTYFMV